MNFRSAFKRKRVLWGLLFLGSLIPPYPGGQIISVAPSLAALEPMFPPKVYQHAAHSAEHDSDG